jgi:PIN domain nuclease of toxin-antitoxin system
VWRSVKLLLDTHAALWFLSGDERLGGSARRHLIDDSNLVLLSAAVVWEVAIKRSLGKVDVPEEYLSLLLGAGVQTLAISGEHAAAVEDLPQHHRDPFDRMLVAQAAIEGAALVSRDEALRPYDVTLIW